MSDTLVTTEIDGGIALVTLNRPQAMNALSVDLCTQLVTAVDRLEADPGVRVIILTGAGDKAFTAGVDLKELGGEADALAAADQRDPLDSLGSFSGPIIGAINGVAISGGFELALACDVLIASTNARFADTHARVGILPGWGLSQKLSRMIGISRAKELSLTGNFLDAKTAADWGVVNRVVAPEDLLPAARKLAEDMISVPEDTQIIYKKLIDDGYAQTLGDALEMELSVGGLSKAYVTSEDVAQRRLAIQKRGRKQ